MIGRAALLAFLFAGGAAARPVDDEIRHYLRSNRDGSSPEHIVHFRPATTDVAVYKWVRTCADAAYVTAQMDPVEWEARSMIAGRVAKDGTQQRIGTLTLIPTTRTLRLVIDLPEGRLRDTARVPEGLPWFLFDYDLGDLNAWLQERRPDADFRFAWALVWPENRDALDYLATVQATHHGLEHHDGRPARRFELSFVDGRTGSGTLWLDPASGAIIEAQVDQPNYPGMTDYRLRLERVETGGRRAWRRLLAAHYGACPG